MGCIPSYRLYDIDIYPRQIGDRGERAEADRGGTDQIRMYGVRRTEIYAGS